MNTSKIIKAYIGTGTYSTTEPITQGDYGYILQIEGAELPATYRVDFSNDRHEGEALPVYGNESGAEVPKELIDTGKDVYAFYYYIEENFGKTAYTWKIPNDTRAKYGNRVPTPTQQDSIDQLIVRSNEAVESAEQSASAAGQSAQNAFQDANRAETARNTAQGYASNAQLSATQASNSASSANLSASASAQSANQSAQIKADVEDLVDDAQGYANASAQSASASANSAATAQGYAQSASASAQSASGYASQAQTSAQTASAKASEASQSATTASQKATESAQSASQALTYKTDAESAKTASQTAQGLAESARDNAIQAKEDAESARDEAQSLVDGISGKVEQIDANTASIESLEDDRYKPYVTDSASGSIASFTDGADNLPLKSLIVDINPVQDLHGQDAPYPAGGGKNILPYATIESPFTKNGITFVRSQDGSIAVNGTSTASFAQTFVDFALQPGSYYFNCGNSFSIQPNTYAYIRDIDNSRTLAEINANSIGIDKPFSIDVQTNVRFYMVFGAAGLVISGTLYPMVRLASVTDATYAPYENICPISGHDEVNVWRTGKNLFGGESFARAVETVAYPDQFSIDTEAKTFVFTRANLIEGGYEHPIFVPKVPMPMTAIMTYSNSRANTSLIFKYTNGSYKQISLENTNGAKATCVINSNNNIIKYIALSYYSNSSTTVYYDESGFFGGILSASDFSSYTGRSITISLGQTVYGGHLDVISGELVIDRHFVDPSQWTQYNASNGYKAYRIQHIPNGRYGNDAMNKPISNMIAKFGGFSSSAMRENIIQPPRINADTAYLALQDGIDPTTVELSYLIANPFTIQLTPNQVNSLLGVNNIWADSGDTEVEYRADTKLFIERLTAPDSVDMVADANIQSGKFFMVGNTLYRALANIASGATITIGTNAQRVSLSDALNLVNA